MKIFSAPSALFRKCFSAVRRFSKTSLPTLLLVIVVLGLLFPHSAFACGSWLKPWTKVGCVAGGIGNAILDGVLHAVEAVLGAIAGLMWDLSEVGARFLTWILTTFNSEIGFVDNVFVQNGWIIVRDIANWFFIIFLMVAAFSTVLNLQSYSARQVLPSLIIIALLINFSLFITGFFVNVSQVVMLLFIKNGAAQSGDIGLALHNAMRMGNLRESADSIRQAINGTGGDVLEEFAVIALYLLNIAFALATAFIFFFMAIMFIVRVVFLWILMITAPLAFAARILPRTKSFYDDWLSNFFNWTIFGIIASFFVWLATWLAQYLSTQPVFNLPTASTSPSGSAMPALLGIAGYLMQYITIFIFLWLAIKFSKKFAGQAASIATHAIAGATVGAAIPATAYGLARLRQSRLGTAAQGAAGRAVLRTPLSRVPGLRGAARGLVLSEEERRQREEGTVRGVENATNANAGAIIRSAPKRGQRKGAEALARQGRLENVLNDNEIKRLQQEEARAKDGPPALQRAAPHLIDNAKQQKDILDQMRSEHYTELAKGNFWKPPEKGKSLPPSVVNARKYVAEEGKWEHVAGTLRNGTQDVVDQVVQEVKDAKARGKLSPQIEKAWTSMAGRSLGLPDL